MNRSHHALFRDYLLLAREMLAAGAVRGSIACTTAAVHLKPASPSAWRMAKAAAERAARRPRNVEDKPSPHVRDLYVRKRRLDRQLVGLSLRLDVASIIHAPRPAASSASEAPPLDDGRLREDLIGILRRVHDAGDALPEQTRGIMGEFRARFHSTDAELAAPPAKRDQDNDRLSYGDLSLEHEIHNLANDFYKINRFRDAVELYTAALAIRPELLESCFNRGLGHTRSGDYDLAAADLNKVVELNPNLSEAYYTRGLIREYQLRYKDAIRDYDKALEVDPNYDKAVTQRQVARDKLAAQEKGPGDSGAPSPTAYDKDGRIQDFSFCLLKGDHRLAEVVDSGGAVRELRKIVYYLKGDPTLAELGARPPSGVLLVGPPGVGKTYTVAALAAEADCPCYAPPPTIFLDMWAGNSERNLRNLWQQASTHEKAIIFIDEIDGLASRRTGPQSGESWYNKMVVTLLELMGGARSGSGRLVVIGATNRLPNIDRAFRREGRFDRIIHLPMPSARALAGIWLVQLQAAERRATRPNLLDPALHELLHRPERSWLDGLFLPGAPHDTGLADLARLSKARNLTGAAVRELIRRVVEDRGMAEIEMGIRAEPLTIHDLRVALEGFEPNLGEEPDDQDQEDRQPKEGTPR